MEDSETSADTECLENLHVPHLAFTLTRTTDTYTNFSKTGT